MINITINNKHIAAPPESTILQAARSAGIHIPVLCEFPALET
nr:(2Fe-2S)-binding protein [Synergistaceae bacterium]